MDAENSEILRELDDTLPDNVSLTDNVQNNLSTDLDTDLEKFDVPNDGFDQPETVFGCEVEVGESLGETGDSFGCAKELTQDATETEESVKALLEQEKGEVQLSPDGFTEVLPDVQEKVKRTCFFALEQDDRVEFCIPQPVNFLPVTLKAA